ncbi:pfs protein [Verticillium dahliae VdLs.17]|uniref:Pfs protein n=1 Tax=Verticillium dahliae (strain VdLs.17 / ATCC MYA-4575 / FGSC 10137) TaxID=498257 RepID=G2X1I7_VERDV|nr:pfs protein [Verticillium dahliae VdLs.17]EGY22160.1 pfs protein [Verticillium dahliae VdLs.17]KAH6704545.1 pfs protein [Verticillium dahliae]
MNSKRPYHEGESQSGYSKRPKPFDVNSRADAGSNPAPHNALRSSVMHKYTIAWICALPLELAASRAMLDEEHEAPVIPASHNNQYVLGHIGHQNVVMTCLPRQYGNNNAALVATNLKRSFPGVIVSLMVGIGGGSPSMADLYLGDVVVGTRVMQYDLGKILSAGWFQSTADPKIPSSRLRSTITGCPRPTKKVIRNTLRAKRTLQTDIDPRWKQSGVLTTLRSMDTLRETATFSDRIPSCHVGGVTRKRSRR